WRILRITHTGQGKGEVEMQGVIFYDKDCPVPLERKRVYKRGDLNEEWQRDRVVRQMVKYDLAIIKLAGAVAETGLTMGRAAVGKAIGKKLVLAAGRAAVQRGLLRVFTTVCRISRNVLLKCVLSFLNAFAVAFVSDLRRRQQLEALRRLAAPQG